MNNTYTIDWAFAPDDDYLRTTCNKDFDKITLNVYKNLLYHLPNHFDIENGDLSWFCLNSFNQGLPEMSFRNLAKSIIQPLSWHILPYYNTKSWNDCYREYLQSDNWYAIRKQVLLRDNYKCSCGCVANQVHHLTYKNVGMENTEDLISICIPCHEAIPNKF